ncbi:glycosyltransferase family 2 protein [soil metagenome]
MRSWPSITVGIVNYNGADHLPALLESLAHQTIAHDTIIVDNASTDGSARAAYERFPEHSYLPLRRNTGFALAANIIAERSPTDVLIYVNPDTRLDSDFVECITAPFAGNECLASVAGTLVFESQPDVIASAGISLHGNGVALDRLVGEPGRAGRRPEPIFGASGGAAAYRRSAFLDAGGFPEVFFMYLEDVDLAFRLQLRGWDCIWQPDAIARHAYSASAGEGSPFKRKLIARNRIWTLARCFPQSLLSGRAHSIVGYDLLALGYGIFRDRPSAAGRAEALARILPRWCERRAIDPDRGKVGRIEGWLQPPISPRKLQTIRTLTAELASRG